MNDRPLKFHHQVIDPDPPGRQHDITLVADLTGDGRPDIIGKAYADRHVDVWFNET